MFAFWIVAGLTAAAAALWLTRPVRAFTAQKDADRAALRNSLEEIEASGDADDAVRAEAARRLLSASDQDAKPQETRFSRALVFAAVVAAPLAALALYLPDSRPDFAGASYDALAAERRASDPADLTREERLLLLSDLTDERPDDAQAWSFYGDALAEAGRDLEAAQAWSTALSVGGPDPDLLIRLGGALTRLSEGEISDEAASAFAAALELRPGDVRATILLAEHAWSRGRSDDAIALWESAAAALPEDAPIRAGVLARLAQARDQTPLSPGP